MLALRFSRAEDKIRILEIKQKINKSRNLNNLALYEGFAPAQPAYS